MPSREPRPEGCGSETRRKFGEGLLLAALFFLEVVDDAEAGTGSGVHLLGGVDRGFQFRDPVLTLESSSSI